MRLPRPWKKIVIHLIVRGRQQFKKIRNDFKSVEVELYDVNVKLRPYFRYFSILLLFLALTSLIATAGFELSPRYARWNDFLDVGIAVGFVGLYISRLVLTSSRMPLIKSRLLETLLFALLVLFGFIYLLGPKVLLSFVANLFNLKQTYAALILLTKVYLVLFVLAKLIQSVPILLSLRRNPAQIIVSSFLGIILLGALFLMLPKATVDGSGLSFMNALFTSTSAVCVTGLIVVDTATYLTTFGQVIVLVLIQLGGIGIITFATLFALFLSSGLGVGQLTFLKDVVSESRVNDTVATLKRIIGLTFFIELIGVAGFYMSWTDVFPQPGERLYASVFHAVSAFCNAGFSTFTNSLADPENALNWGVNITTMLLIIVGGLGFTTLWELTVGNPQRKVRSRQYSVHTRLVIITTGILIVTGTVLFLGLEWELTLKGYELPDKLMISLFQSVTTRTAGFNTVDISALGISMTTIFFTLMAIGASPASTGGGIKTTTVAVLWLSVLATVRGHNRVEFAKKRIPPSIVYTAITAFTLALVTIALSTFLLTITENMDFVNLVFEEISAYATVGLSRGITSSLSVPGKIIIIISMFVGRVGTVTLAVAFAKREDKRKYQYPTESVIVA